jgi:hypothetical protein
MSNESITRYDVALLSQLPWYNFGRQNIGFGLGFPAGRCSGWVRAARPAVTQPVSVVMISANETVDYNGG